MIASAVLILLAAQIEKPPQTADVPRWSVYELTLTATDDKVDPYLETDLVGVFTGPNGQSVVVNGFWDGDRTFHIRFAPTVEGTWTYMTVSSDPAMDGEMGSVKCTPPQPGVHGFVRGPSARATEWTFDDGEPAPADTVRVVPVGGSAVPCGDECAALPSLDRDHLSLASLRAADRVVKESQATGKIAALELFDAFDLSRFDDVQAHRVIDYALARYGAYSNVAWCLHGATPSASSAHAWTALRGVVRMDDPYFTQAASYRVLMNECSADAPSAPVDTSIAPTF
jgi:hypothetical protein